MIRPWHVLPIFFVLPGFLSCQESGEETVSPEKTADAFNEEPYLQKAEEASGVLMKRLGGQLKAALQAGGPVGAVQVCQQVAQPMTQAASGELEGYSISRTALRVRNPKNAPDEDDREVLEKWDKAVEDGAGMPEPHLDRREDGRVVVYRPIMTQEVCLNCHGDREQFGEELQSLLAQSYPEDQAVGFREGSLRGAFKVEFPPEAE
jgi:hypothetical protein